MAVHSDSTFWGTKLVQYIQNKARQCKSEHAAECHLSYHLQSWVMPDGRMCYPEEKFQHQIAASFLDIRQTDIQGAKYQAKQFSMVGRKNPSRKQAKDDSKGDKYHDHKVSRGLRGQKHHSHFCSLETIIVTAAVTTIIRTIVPRRA